MDYSILNINSKASNEEIRKAYHTLARKYHPDKNLGDKQAEKKFKEINKAYENIVKKKPRIDKTFFYSFTNISIPPEFVNLAEKMFQTDNGKSIYDKISKVNKIFTSDFSKNMMSEIFNYKNFYDNINKNEPNGYKNEPNGYKNKTNDDTILDKTDNIEVSVNIKLEDIYNKVKKTITIRRFRKCKICNSLNKCFKCNGKMIKEAKEFSFNSNHNEVIFFGESDEDFNKIPGDIVIKINPKPNNKYQVINKYNLLIEENISLYEAYNGYSFYFTHLNKNKYRVSYNKPIINNKLKKIANMGLPIPNSDKYGYLFIKFKITLPNITPQQLESMNQMNLSIRNTHLFDDHKNDKNDYYDNAEIILANPV